MGQTRPVELAEMLRFDPGWIKDPPPWLISVLSKAAILEIGRVHLEFQKTVATSYAKTLEQVGAVIQKEIGR